MGSGGKKISRFVFKFVGWVCVYACWLALISEDGGWIFLCERKFLGLGSAGKKILRLGLCSLIWVRVLVFSMFFLKTNEFLFIF